MSMGLWEPRYYYRHYHYLCNLVLNCLLECSIWEYVTAFFARLQFTTILLWCSDHHHHHQKFTSFCNSFRLPSSNKVYYYYYYGHHFIILFGTFQSLLIGLAANSGTVMGNSFVRIDVSMEISPRQFHLGKIGHTEDVVSPKATAICPWIKWAV